MKQVRLLPIVVFAASALLVLKTIGIVSGGGYTLSGVGAVWAADGALSEEQAAEAAQAQEQAELAAAEAAAASLFASVPGTDEGQDAIAVRENDGLGSQVNLGEGGTQEVILQRLAERRAELDAFAAELETRLAVVEAAELRIEERMDELSAIEAEINSIVDAREAAEAEQFAAVVAMYEAMRPADAATIFNDLDTGVLVRVGRSMNPRKLGPIMAKMEPTKAQELTVLLAQREMPPEPVAEAQDFSDLPQIVGQ